MSDTLKPVVKFDKNDTAVSQTNKSPGFFIVFDGMDGSGKSTQIMKVKERLEARGHNVVITREPGGSPSAEDVRSLLVNGEPDRWDKLSELFLFTAARRNHVETLIKPALAEGSIVLCDRFVPSTVAYQGYGHGLDLDIIKNVTKLAIGNFKPDLLIIFECGLEEGLARTHKRRGTEMRFESLDLDFHHRVRNGYKAIVNQIGVFGKVQGSLDTTLNEDDTTIEEGIERITHLILAIIDFQLLKDPKDLQSPLEYIPPSESNLYNEVYDLGRGQTPSTIIFDDSVHQVTED